jgi:hypothetical protein
MDFPQFEWAIAASASLAKSEKSSSLKDFQQLLFCSHSQADPRIVEISVEINFPMCGCR